MGSKYLATYLVFHTNLVVEHLEVDFEVGLHLVEHSSAMVGIEYWMEVAIEPYPAVGSKGPFQG